MKMRHIAMAVAVALSSSYAMADTSSAIRGRISNPEGAAAAGTKVIILHVPSGTSRTVITNEGGSFVASGLRVGGPYKIIVDSDTYADETVNDVFLQLGDTYQLNKQLQANDVERIAVTGAAIATANNGSSSYFGEDDIRNAPSLNNDLKDIVKNNPLAVLSPKDGELSVAGTNPRYNSISVDGIAQNDDFGLNANGYPTTRSPISFDAIDQITIDVSPFNAKDGGFQGGKINAVTKSGGNDTFGSFKYEIKNDSLAGTPENRFAATAQNPKGEVPLEYDNKNWAATLGGAVVQDKLFYFISAESYDATPPLEWGPAGSGLSNATAVTQEQIDQVANIARTVYGVDVGDWNVVPEETDEKLLLKLDWNINDEHRAAYTYQYNKGNQTQGNQSNSTTMRLSSNWYNKEETLNNHAFKLYSDWNSDFSTQLSATYMDVATVQKSLSDFGDVSIRVPRFGGNAGQTATIAIGSDLSRHSNDLQKKTWILAADGDYLMDDHRLSFGYQFKRLDIFNLFLQRTKGQYTFNSIADFQNQIASIRYQNAISHNPNDAAADFVRDEHALYINDEWAATDELTLDVGLRYERLGSNDKPAFNAFSLARTGYDNSENLDGIDILLPRLGFTYTATEDLTLRGGVGRFSGGQPTVWISNSYSNVGIGTGDRTLNNLTGVKLDQIPQALKDAVAGVTTGGNTNLVDPNFNLPSDWRYQLAADYVFSLPVIGDDINWTTELLYVQKQDSVVWKDVSILPSEQIATTPDGQRKIYRDTDGVVDIMLTNAEDDGRSKIFSTMLSKNWDNGISVVTSYTNQDITEGAPATSSTAGSNYGNNPVINRNEMLLGRSTFETEHRFVVNFGYETELFSGYATNVSMFYERRSGKPINYLLGVTDFNGPQATNPYVQLSPGTTNNYFLPFIPVKGDYSVVKFANPAAEATFWERVTQLGLDQYQGQYLPKGVKTTPWVTTLDLSLRQEIPGFAEGHKGSVYLNIENLLNLIDSSKGKVYGDDFGDVTLANFTLDQNTYHYVYNNITSNQRNWDKFYTEKSTWRMKVGVSYNF
ncbi:TonB-dependent receptor [Rheinheimera sp. 4Y26]|uniref:TonB-dependent receptor n=1 Tax=Rheinheimera sp. 4Y26 TaxID=2977811 RepID=UPI0021B12B0B|nr:TonB-dependent receptor [Rheinheimera sp. 4Y26]MCT6701249.1 TonB-dependent receptor [Rheinheimera sp. 4Y26]